MGHKNREIEIKLLASGTPRSFKAISALVEHYVNTVYPEYEEIRGKSNDIYWSNLPNHTNADFIRLRKNPSGPSQITVKSCDRGSNLDRVEIDVEIVDYSSAKALMKFTFGENLTTVTKRYDVFFLENDHTNISVYYVTGDDKVFVEIEGTTLARVKELTSGVAEALGGEIRVVGSSIYDMFVANKEPKLLDLKDFLNQTSK